MAHNLNINQETGKASFFTVKEKAWHGLGTIVKECPNSREAIKLAGLDFDVEQEDVYAHINEKEEIIPNKYVNFRKDTGDIFGIVGSKYTVVQNRDAFEFFDAIVGEGAAIFETAGCLDKGQTIFITAKLPKDLVVLDKKDLIEQYIFLTSSHDGSGSIIAAFTPVRIVCNNTLNAALKQMTNKVAIRHTASAVERLKQAHTLMGITHKVSEELGKIFKAMSKKKITDKQLLEYIKRSLAPRKEILTKLDAAQEMSARFNNMTEECYVYATTSPTQQTPSCKGTVFGAYNAITGYYQNVKGFENSNDKLSSIMFGTGFNRSQKAFDLALTYINN